MGKILSIIIPTFNMEKYLAKCVSSVILPDTELMKQLEVLIVNDGSIDQSSSIAHQYEKLYPDVIRVIDKENGNYGSCINAALPLATGKYVKILDADDWFDTVNFTAYLNQLTSIEVDVVLNDFDMVGLKTGNNNLYTYHLPPLSQSDLSALATDYGSVWMHAVAYRTSLLLDLQYKQTEGISYTDQEWIFIPMAAAKSVFYIPGVLYHYYQGRDDQTVNINVFEKNFWMETKGLDIMMSLLERCLADNNTYSGISVNIEYLKERIYCRCGVVYTSILMNPRPKSYLGYLKNLDARIMRVFPDVYEKLSTLVYPSTLFSQYKIRTRFVKTWRQFGLVICRVQLRLVQHYMGVIYHLDS